MTVRRARIVRAEPAARGALLMRSEPGRQARRIAREELEGRLRAERLVEEAREQAGALIAAAREQAAATVARERQAAREEEHARLVARWLALRDAEARNVGGDVDRLVPLAVALAERLVGAALAVDPSRIAALAAGVLAEARGARRAVIEASPGDADELRRQLTGAGLSGGSFEVKVDERLARGALRLHTDIGVIDAQLAPRLERLAAALRDALG